MLNTDIFKFELVNREDERTIIDAFLNNVDAKYVLWMNGARGVGKSYLLTEYVASVDNFASIYVNIDIHDISSACYIKTFISQLNRVADLKFLAFLRANYNSIVDIGQKAFNVFLKITDLDDIGLDELSSSITNFYISKQGTRENTVSVVKKYILEALESCDKLLFLLDNFSQCDELSLDIIIQIIHYFQSNSRVKFIICTTEDDLSSRIEIKTALAEKIANKQLQISPFKNKFLFTQMIEKNFNLSEENIKLLAKAFALCQGYPQRFKEVLINLYAKQGIVIDGNKALFSLDIFKQILINEEINFDIDNLCKEHKGVKIILQVIALWGVPISSSILYEFLEFFADNDPTPVLKKEISQSIQILEGLHILVRSFNEHFIILQYKHDSLKNAIIEYFKDDRSLPFLHYSMYEFLMRQKDVQTNPYWNRYHYSLSAYHSYASHAHDWIDINYSFGSSFYKNEQYSEAKSIFSRLEKAVPSLDGSQLLRIGITFYKCGYYSKSNDILTNIQSRNLIDELTIVEINKLYIFLARANTCLLNNEQAFTAISKAEEKSMDNTDLHIATLAAKQSLLFMTPGHFKEAKELFDTLVLRETDIPEMALVYQSAIDYYEGEKSLYYLTKGLNLSKKHLDFLTEGKTLNNMGFEYLRCGHFSSAETLFWESISIIKEHQPHELAYPYNNLAVTNMILGKWNEALKCIMESLFWNKSNYLSLVLKTNRMICYYFNNNELWKEIHSELYEFITSKLDIDDKIYKKIGVNLALLALKSEDFETGIEILDYCEKHLANEWEQGMYRFNNIYNELSKTNMKTQISDIMYQKYYCDIEFEPWLVNFTHD